MGFSSDDDTSDYIVERREYSPEELKRFIVSCVSDYEKDKAIYLIQHLHPNNKLAVQPILDCMINNEDKKTTLTAIVKFLSGEKGTALHYAADQASYVLIAALLDHGESPNTRRAWNDNMKRALPLNVVLALMAREILESFEDRNPLGKLSGFKLVCEMCSIEWRPTLECIRILALRTTELNDEIIKYRKEGKVIELCALMLLGYDLRVPAVADDSTKEEQVLQLFDTFARIGDKLQTYVELNSSPFGHCVTGLVSEIGSIFKDAGLRISNKDNLIYHGRYDLVVIDLVKRALSSRSQENRPGESGSSHDVTLGSRSLHTSSVLKAHKGVMHSSPLKGFVLPKPKPQFWWNPSLMMAVRRVTRHV